MMSPQNGDIRGGDTKIATTVFFSSGLAKKLASISSPLTFLSVSETANENGSFAN